MSNDPSQSDTRPDMPDDQAAASVVSLVKPAEDATATVTAGDALDGPSVGTNGTTHASAPDASEPSALDAELAEARNGVFEAIAAWLSVTWEQPILRAMSSNAGRAVENAQNFPALRAELRALQANARQTAEDAVAPLLNPDVHLQDQGLTSSVDAVALQLVGLIGGPLRDSGFDPLSGGLERIQDGFRLKTMTEHDQINAALQRYSGVKASLAAERAEQIERDRESARAEVERLWQATAELE